jgi:hypothetical protein
MDGLFIDLPSDCFITDYLQLNGASAISQLKKKETWITDEELEVNTLKISDNKKNINKSAHPPKQNFRTPCSTISHQPNSHSTNPMQADIQPHNDFPDLPNGVNSEACHLVYYELLMYYANKGTEPANLPPGYLLFCKKHGVDDLVELSKDRKKYHEMLKNKGVK